MNSSARTLSSRALFALALSAPFAVASAFAAGCSETAPDSPVEAGVEASADAAVDASADAPDSRACEPVAAASETSTTDSGAFFQARCSISVDQISPFVDCTFDPGKNPSQCKNLYGTDGADDCQRCLMTSPSAPVRGAILIDDRGFGRLNVAGCIENALAGAGRDPSCAKAYAKFEDCVAVACEGCRQDGIPAYEACATAARNTTCALHPNDQACVRKSLLPGEPAAICNVPSHFLTAAISYGKLFCLPPPADGGADAASDATFDATTD